MSNFRNTRLRLCRQLPTPAYVCCRRAYSRCTLTIRECRQVCNSSWPSLGILGKNTNRWVAPKISFFSSIPERETAADTADNFSRSKNLSIYLLTGVGKRRLQVSAASAERIRERSR